MRRGFRWLVLLTAMGAALVLGQPWAPAGQARTPAQPFLTPQPLVVLSDRPVCSLLSAYKGAAGIIGQDGSQTVAADGVVFWNFGDTLMADGSSIPNSLGWSADMDASDCIHLVPLQDTRQGLPLLALLPDELTVWPLGMEVIAPGRVGFYYASVVADADLGYRVRGVGIASFDTTTHIARRELGGLLPWEDGMPLPSRTVADGEYIYTFLTASRATWTSDTILARVPKSAFASPSQYEYWEPANDGAGGAWVGGLWHQQSASWDASVGTIGALWRQAGAHNGVQAAYNDFLGRWVGVYTTDFMSSLNARTAAAITGPWDQADTVLVDCPAFHPPAGPAFICYTGAQHAAYQTDGGRTIYVSYSNEATYQVYLHQIRLAAAINQWSDSQGHAVYLPAGHEPPEGYTLDGLAFYASDTPVPGFAPIHRWEGVDTGEIRYGAFSPQPARAYRDAGADFYAPTTAGAAATTNVGYAPVYRWRNVERQVYGALDLAGASGYAQLELAFYAACPAPSDDRVSGCVAPDVRPPATATPTPTYGSPVFGDANCDGTVNPIDAALILQFVVGATGSAPCAMNADVSAPAGVDAVDAALILQFGAGIVASLPPG